MMRKQLMKIFSERMHKLNPRHIFSIVVPAYSSLDFYNVAGHIIFLIAGFTNFMVCAGGACHDPDNPSYKMNAWHFRVMNVTWLFLTVRFAALIKRWYLLGHFLARAHFALPSCIRGRQISDFTSACIIL